MLLLVRTSNPGAADVEELELAGVRARVSSQGARAALVGAGTVWERLAQIVDELGRHGVEEGGSGPSGMGAQGALSDVGAVIGATAPGHLARARELMPNAVFLLPGVGAQGGRVEDLAPAFAPGARAAWSAPRAASRRLSAIRRRSRSGWRSPREAERLREIALGAGADVGAASGRALGFCSPAAKYLNRTKRRVARGRSGSPRRSRAPVAPEAGSGVV